MFVQPSAVNRSSPIDFSTPFSGEEEASCCFDPDRKKRKKNFDPPQSFDILGEEGIFIF